MNNLLKNIGWDALKSVHDALYMQGIGSHFKLFSAPESVVVKTIFPAVLCLVPNLTYLVSRGQIRRNFDNIDWIKFLLFELKSLEMSYTESKDRGYVNAVV